MIPQTELTAYCDCLYQQLRYGLDQLNDAESTDTTNFEGQIVLVQASIHQLRERILSGSFESIAEEIHFMKNILPAFLSLVIYYSEKADWNGIRQIPSQNVRQELLELKSEEVETFFRENIEFILYYYSGSNNMDEQYFLREQHQIYPFADFCGEWAAPAFCTIYACKLGMLLAYSKLEQEMKNTTSLLSATPPTTNSSITKLEWTDSKSGLLELIYSLKEQGAFNHGKADIKTIADHFSRSFSIDLGNTSSSFQKLLYRKTGQTQYIDQLRERLLKRIEQIDLQAKT